MQWDKESKKAFIQALNIKFLTTIGAYTNFQFVKRRSPCSLDEVHMLFSGKQKKECQKYLTQIVESYKNILGLSGSQETIFYVNSFPFYINSDHFSSKRGRGVKIKVPLNARVVRNLYYIFLSQFLSFRMSASDLPKAVDITQEQETEKKYTNCWIFFQTFGGSSVKKREIVKDLVQQYGFTIGEEDVLIEDSLNQREILSHCVYIHQDGANEAVQGAIKDFPTAILRQYPTKLLALFNVFYHDLSSKESMSPCCRQLIRETWAKCVHTARADGNIVSFDYDGDSTGRMLDEQVLYEINELYKGRATEGTFSNFINLTHKDPTTTTASFNFNLHNMSVIMKKVSCNIEYVEKAREFAIEQRNGTARPIHVVSFSRMPKVANDTVPSSSKQNFLKTPSKSSDLLESNVSPSRKGSSNDSAFERSLAKPSCSNTSPELHINAASFNSGNGSNSSLPINPTTSPTHSDITVISKNGRTGSVGNIADLDKSEPKPNKVESQFIRNSGRSKSVPLNSLDCVLSTITIKRSSSDIEVKA